MSGNAKILIAKETTYNTAPASGWRQLEWEADDHVTRPQNAALTFKGIRPSAGAPSFANRRASDDGADGTFSAPAASNGQGILWAAAAGESTSDVVLGGTDAFEQIHVFGGSASQDTIASSFYRDRLSGDLDEYVFRGGKVTQVEVGNTVDELVKVKWTLSYAASDTADSTPTDRSETVVTPDFFYSWEEALITLVPYVDDEPGDLEDDGTAECIESFSLTIPMGLDEGAKCMKRGALREEPVRITTPEPSGTLNWRYQKPDYYNAFRAGEPFMLVADWLGTTAIEDTTFPRFTITIPCILFDSDADPHIAADGPTMEALPFKVYDNEVDDVITVRNVTTDEEEFTALES